MSDAVFLDKWLKPPPRVGRGPGAAWFRLRFPKIYFAERALRAFLDDQGGAGRELHVHEQGCGPGFNVHALRQLLGGHGDSMAFSGSDMAPRAVEFASQQLPEAGVHFVVDDMQASSLADESYDVMLSLDVLGHLPDLETAVDHIARCLRPGGRYVTFTETSGYRDDAHSWRHEIVQRNGVDPWIEKDLHVNLKPSAEIERIFRERGLEPVLAHPNRDGKTYARLGCKDVSEMVAMTGIEPDDFLRGCIRAERVGRATGLQQLFRFSEKVGKYSTGDRGQHDLGGYYFVFEKAPRQA